MEYNNDIVRETGIIRQIAIGADYKNAMKYTVGNVMNNGKYKITDITENVHDEAYLGTKSYDIHVELIDKPGISFIWWSWVNPVCGIQYMEPA
jgi:hypothetical protein